MKNVLIDTDVFLDFFFDRKPFSEYAANLLQLCIENKINGFTTPLIIANLYYLLRKTAKHEQVIEKLQQLLTFIDVIEIDKTAVTKALHSEFKDFEDALQNFAAINHSKVSVVITRNVKDFVKSNLAILTPETFLKGFTKN